MSQQELPIAPPPPALWQGGSLGPLMALLTTEARQQPDQWAARILTRGATVLVRIDPTGRRTLRISRPLVPEGRYLKAWAHEVATFLHYLGAEGWMSVATDATTGIAADFVERFGQETLPGKTRCAAGHEVAYDMIQSPARCHLCEKGATG